MDRSRGCDRRPAVEELALGILTGAERAEALAHVASCPACRAELERLAESADQLLLLTPPAEPPPGFESAVLAAMEARTEGADRGRRPPRWIAPVVSAAAVVLIALGASVWIAGSRTEGPREAAMVTPSGREVGEVRLEAGDPAWMLISVPGWKRWDTAAGRSLDYRVRVGLVGGNQVEIPDLRLSARGEWGGSASFEPGEVRWVSIVDSTGHVWCTARLG